MGHAYMVVLVFMCQTIVYREVTTLFSLKPKSAEEQANGRDPWSKTLNWYFFAVVNYFLYGESIIYYFKVCYQSYIRLSLIYSLLFLTACSVLGRAAHRFRHEPSVHQLFPLYYWVHGLCHVLEAWLSQAAIWTVLLGTYVAASRRCVKVGGQYCVRSRVN